MINKNLLEQTLINKFTDQLVTSVVTEAYIRALPLNRDSIIAEMSEIKEYTKSVMESLGPTHCLAAALEANPKNAYLSELADDIITTATEAAKRCCSEASKCADVSDVVDKSEFTKDELAKFKKKGSAITIKELGDIINKKVVDVIKIEKSEYDESEALKEKLSTALDEVNNDAPDEDLDAMAEEDDTEDDLDIDSAIEEDEEKPFDEKIDSADTKKKSSLESFMDTMFTPFDVKEHLSVFSRLQESAMEAVLAKNSFYEEVPVDVLTKITMESSLGDFTPVETSLEDDIKALASVTESAVASMSDEEFSDSMKTATTCAVLVYTLLETLKTMKLHNPSLTDVRKYVEAPITMSKATENNINKIREKAKTVLAGVRAEAKATESIEALTATYESYRDLYNSINELPEEYNALKTELTTAIESTLGEVQNRMDVVVKTPEIAKESYYDIRDREHNVSEFNRIGRSYAKRPTVNEIRIILDKANESAGIVPIELRARNGNLVEKTMITINKTPQYETFEDCVLESALVSQITYCGKNLNVYDANTCKMRPLL